MATEGPGAADGAHGEPKVTPIHETELGSSGFRSQKELSVVSKSKVWSLVKGYIGSNASEAVIFIRDKAVASRHAEVFTIDSTTGTDGYWIAAATAESTTNLLLSAERGVRTRGELALHGIVKLGAEVQLELLRIEVRPQGMADPLARYRTHNSVSDMFGHLESIGPKVRDALTAADDGESGFMGSMGGRSRGVDEEGKSAPTTPRSESRKDVRAAALANHAALVGTEQVRTASHDRHVRFDKVLYQDPEVLPRVIGPSWWQRTEGERDVASKKLMGMGRQNGQSFFDRHGSAPAVQHVVVFQVLGGPQSGELVMASSRDGTVVIGSDPTCDLVITGAEVSPVHARISFEENEGETSPEDMYGTLRPERVKRGKDVGDLDTPGYTLGSVGGAGTSGGGTGGAGGAASASEDILPGSVAANVISVKPYQESLGPRTLTKCWIQDLAIGNRYGTQIAVGDEPVALQRGDIIVLCRQLLLEPPEGTVIGTARRFADGAGVDGRDSAAGGAGAAGGDRSAVQLLANADLGASGAVKGGTTIVPAEAAGGTRKKKKSRAMVRQTPYALADRVELAILFHSETAAPQIMWSRLALRVTRTRRSRRKSLHRTSSVRFPSHCVTVGPAGAVIGRSNKCDVLVDDVTAANFHTQIVFVQDGYVLQTIAHPDFFGTFILLGRHSSPHDRYRHESKGLYQLEMNDIFKCGTTEFFVEEIKTETFFELKRRQGALKARVKLLRRSPLFSLLPDLDLTRIANAAVKVHAEPGDVIIQEGDSVNKDACFFFIEKGEVDVAVRRRDKRGSQAINSLGPGQCFGEMAMLAADRPRAATITARTKLTCYSLDWQSSKELLGPVMSAAMALIAEKREVSIRMQLVAHLFSDVSGTFATDELKMLCEMVTPVSFKGGDTIVRKGQDCACVFFVVGGVARIESVDLDGSDRSPAPDEVDLTDPLMGSGHLAKRDAAREALEQTLKDGKGELGPGAAIGDVALLLDTQHGASVVAAEPVACLALAKDAFQALLTPLARWLLSRWSHIESVRNALAHVSKSSTRASATINLDRLAKQGSALDLGAGEGHAAQGVMQVAAAQHARSRAEKWRKASAIRSSENSLVSLSSRDGDEVTADIDKINSSLTELEVVDADDDDDAPITPAHGAEKKEEDGDEIRQSLPPDISWMQAAKSASPGGASPHPTGRTLASTPSFTAVDTTKAEVFEALHEGEGFPTVPPPIGAKGDGGAGGAGGAGGVDTSDDGSGSEDVDGTSLDGRGLVVTTEDTSTTEGASESDAAGRPRRRRKIRYTPRLKIPVTSTNPTVEEVKMLSQIPRFLILRALTGPLRGTYFYVTNDVTTIGNIGGDATIAIPDRTLSPAHACIEYQDGAFWLRDLFSSTGTFLKLAAGKDYTMEMGDVFTIGHVELMVLGKPETPPAPAPANAAGCCSVL
uniref:cGMP-dependent protein kinase n=1 Tax=Bicosoecida sp. CB-2014 TaxID=1486930 RepID=A0A7S1C555_9STRA|mmetsp:Transcript_13874/g.48322  ORF Transcript_13874/g.48322 Transcript_13874/m.48322 type:complete len:1429 (+) Transcript_13874:390-4676(+)